MKTRFALWIIFTFIWTCCTTNTNQSSGTVKLQDTVISLKDSFPNNIDYLKIFDSYNIRYDFDWHGISKLSTNYPDLDYHKISKLLEKESYLFDVNPNAGYFANHLRILDINADGEKDIIYSGPTGGEAQEVILALRSGKSYKKILTIEQGIVKVDWENNRVSKIYSHDWGCCASINLINSVYSFKYDTNDYPDIKKIFQSIEYEFMLKPLEYFEKPIVFKTNINGSALRYSPVVDDTSYFFDDRIGNKIGLVNNGAFGKAYGLQKDKLGNSWWYVIINPNQITNQKILYMKDLDYPTHVIGWLKSNDLIKIK